MLLIDTNIANFMLIVVTSAVGMFGVSMGLEGYIMGHLSWPLRILSIAGGLMLIYPGLMTDIAGVAVVGAIIALQKMKNKKETPAVS